MVLTSRPGGSVAALLLATLVLVGFPSATDAADILWTGTAGNWNTGTNWMGGFVPEAQFEEVGVINNGGTAFIAATAPDAAGVILGQAVGESGTLQILSGGSIDFIDSTGAPEGTANIGLDGVGTLDVRRGGSMSTTLLDVNLGSTVLVGTDVGAGVASLVSTGGMFFNGTTTVRGAGHTFSAAGTVTFEGSSTYIAEITSASHSPLRTSGPADLAGDFRLKVSGGFTPSPGNTWNIIDASAINGAFANIDFSAAPAPAPGTAYQLATVPGGANGQLLQLQLNTLLQLTVNTDTGAVSMSSPSGASIKIDGYSILSDGGLLNVAQWNSLQDQAMPGWFEAAPTAQALNELNANVGGGITPSATPIGLGTPYTTPAFGQSPDIEFEYRTSTGEIVQGLVELTGVATANNLLLTVDSTTGEAQLRNSSNTTLQLVGYSVLSESGSLLPNDGDWLSLEDQNVGSWGEANATSSALNEFILGAGATTLTPGQAFDLGELFDETSESRDLVLEFAIEGDQTARLGAVRYGAIPDVMPPGDVAGDYNGNGVVDAADYTVWRDTFGASVMPGSGADGDSNGVVNQGDYTFWKTRFGNASGAGAVVGSAANVPEPASWSLLISVAMAVCGIWRRRV